MSDVVGATDGVGFEVAWGGLWEMVETDGVDGAAGDAGFCDAWGS